VSMRRPVVAPIVILPWLLLAGCTPSIELVGYGPQAPIQHGLELRLIASGHSGALIYARNTTDDLLSIAVSPLAVRIEVRHAGQIVAPSSRIMFGMSVEPRPDDFAILGPGQTREIPVPVSWEADDLRTYTCIYKLEEGSPYEIEVQIEPYFGPFTEGTAGEVLSRFKLPRYVRETMRPNAMTIRAR